MRQSYADWVTLSRQVSDQTRYVVPKNCNLLLLDNRGGSRDHPPSVRAERRDPFPNPPPMPLTMREGDAVTNMHQQYRTIWISDVHLGTRGCKAEFLLDFLRYTDAR